MAEQRTDTKAKCPQTINLSESEQILLSHKGYKFISQLGEGTYSKVYYGIHVKSSIETPFACKVINTKKTTKDYVSKFLPRELDILSKMSYPHIIHINSMYQRNSKFFVFMRYAEKGDLLEYILTNGEIDERQTRLWFHQIALAVEYLHTIDIAHRDIKCENILITNNMNIKLADFGFARFVVDSNGRSVMSTTYCGSFAYASPEILMGRPYQPKPTDLWAMGVVLFAMLNNRMPFLNPNVKHLVKQQRERSWKFGTKVAEETSAEVALMVGSLLEPEVKKRAIIEDVLEDVWFDMELGLKAKDSREKGAIDVAIRFKDKMVPVGKAPKVTSSRTRQILLLSEEMSEFANNRFLLEANSRLIWDRYSTKEKKDNTSKKPSIKQTQEKVKNIKDRLGQPRTHEEINLIVEPPSLGKTTRLEEIK